MMPPVAILAGGLATRLRPLTERIPKSLLEVAGEPFIAHQLRLLARRGVTRVVLCLGFLGEQVQAFVGDGSRFGLRVDYSFDGDVLLGTGGALRQASGLLGDVFWVTYGDSYLDIEYEPIWRHFSTTKSLGLMTVYLNENQYDRSNVLFEDGQIVRYTKRDVSPAMRHIDFGLLLLRRAALEVIPTAGKLDLSDLLEALVARGELVGFETRHRFYEIGSAAGLAETAAYIRSTSPAPLAPQKEPP